MRGSKGRSRLAIRVMVAALAMLFSVVVMPAGGEASPSGAQDPASSAGYWMLDAEGRIHAFGAAEAVVATGEQAQVSSPAVKVVANPSGVGLWVLEANGTVHPLGGAPDHGQIDAGAFVAGETAATMAATPGGGGLVVFTNRGRAVVIGDATHHGDLVQLGLADQLNGPIIDSAALPDGSGYFMVGSDGGVFAFGAAVFAGSVPEVVDGPLNSPVNGMVVDPDGTGYWMVAGDGGVFAFDADFVGSLPGVLAPGTVLNAPINGMVPYGNGYLMVASDGGVFNFATDLDFVGSLGGQALLAPITNIAPVPTNTPPNFCALPPGARPPGTLCEPGLYRVGIDVTPGPYRYRGSALRYDENEEVIDLSDRFGLAAVDDGFGYVIVEPGDTFLRLQQNPIAPSFQPQRHELIPAEALPDLDPLAAGFLDGTYRVGDEVAPGLYRFSGSVERFDAQRVGVGFDGVGSGFGLVVLRSSDAFVSYRADRTYRGFGDPPFLPGLVLVSDLPDVDPVAEGYSDGAYLVGPDVAPGRYRVEPATARNHTYWARLDDQLAIVDDEANGDGALTFTIEPSDFAVEITGTLVPCPPGPFDDNACD